jgi:hypothetical protein
MDIYLIAIISLNQRDRHALFVKSTQLGDGSISILWEYMSCVTAVLGAVLHVTNVWFCVG